MFAHAMAAYGRVSMCDDAWFLGASSSSRIPLTASWSTFSSGRYPRGPKACVYRPRCHGRALVETAEEKSGCSMLTAHSLECALAARSPRVCQQALLLGAPADSKAVATLTRPHRPAPTARSRSSELCAMHVGSDSTKLHSRRAFAQQSPAQCRHVNRSASIITLRL